MEPVAYFSGRLIAYSEASPDMLAQALTATQQEFHARFPLADAAAWQQAFERCQPELWLGEEGPVVEHGSLIRVINSLHTGQLTDDEADPPRYSHRAYHLARKLTRYGKWAASVLAQHPDLMTPKAQADVQLLLMRLETGDAVAEQITEAFRRPSGARSVTAFPPQPPDLVPSEQSAVVAPPEQPSLEVRWAHLQRWVALHDNSLRPWNTAAIARQTQFPHSTVRTLLTASPLAAETEHFFTSRRLRLLQRLFQPFGYK